MNPSSQAFVEQIGTQLLEKNLIDERSLMRAQRASENTGERFDHVLIHLGLVPEKVLYGILADMLSLNLIKTSYLPEQAILTDQLGYTFLKRNKIIPITKENGHIKIAMADPFNHDAMNTLAYLLECDVQPCLMLHTDFEKALDKLYPQTSQDSSHASLLSESDELETADIERLKDISSEAPIIQLVNQFIADAVEQGASDIHIEPLENHVRIRLRLDGKLHVIRELPLSQKAAVISRIKILGKLNIAERRLPQDGRIKIPVRGVDIDFRLSTTPTLYGESVVMRILDRSAVELDFVSLGFHGASYQKYCELLDQPNGIILVTGPTGSGKTTTLYTSLDMLNKQTRKIFTVEDPIEYQLNGINQVQIKPKVGLTFANALRSILRQDPDIIMIGEIRDLETAQIAIQASLTGHLVLSTLHTNNAAATLTRLLDMGVEDYLLASTVNGILAQRLVRKLCDACAVPDQDKNHTADLVAQAKRLNLDINKANVRQPVGCAKCYQTGFSGRMAITEFLVIDQDMRHILADSSERKLETKAKEKGMRTLYEDGLVKVLNGETTLEEVLDVTQMN
ncbi:MAG: GspE/PulE family protein [Pseudomonadota bacterium]